MTEPEISLPDPDEPIQTPKRRRLRRFFLRHVPLTLAGGAVLIVIATVGLYFWASSSQAEALVRKRLIALIEQSTGGRAEIATFHWRLLDLQAEAGGLVVHGLEAPEEAPYAQVESLRVHVSILGLLSPRILLRDVTIVRPAFHFIVFDDGLTNQPQPLTPQKTGKSAVDTFFDMQAGHISVQQGVLHYENRAAVFDVQDRFIPIDFEASDVSLISTYIPADSGHHETYRIEAGAADLNLSRGKDKPMTGSMQASLDLTRNAANLRFLRITSKAPVSDKSFLRLFQVRPAKNRTVEITGTLEDFNHPHWQAKAVGDMDMRLLDPIFGFPLTPAGVAHVDLDGAGQSEEFRADGSVHVDDGAYVGTGVYATGIRLDAHVHADAKHLLLTSIVAHLRQGGQLEGQISLTPWLPEPPGAAALQSSDYKRQLKPPTPIPGVPFRPPPDVVPFNGNVTAQFKDVSLDTLLDIVGQGPFQRLGINTRINGPATAKWSNGDTQTVVVGATFSLTPSGQPSPNEVPATGAIDATYTQRDGGVDLRRFEVLTPASQLEVHGHLGAFPLIIPSALAVEFHSQKLDEFDTVLRDLGLNGSVKPGGSRGKSTPPPSRAGTAALPGVLAGQAQFRGTWTGSLVDPHLAGTANATQLALELPVMAADNPAQTPATRLVRFDSIEATGSYSAARIDISRGLLRRGKAEINLSGTLEAAPARPTMATFDANSVLHARLQAKTVNVDDLQALAGQNLAVTGGTLDAQLQADGPVHALGGSGWVELSGGSVYGEPVTHLRAQGTITNDLIRVASLNATAPAGSLSATGSYDIKGRRFQIDAKGAGIDVAKIDAVQRQGLDLTGNLAFSAVGSGTFDDPRFEAHATLNPLTLASEPLGGLDFTAHAANRSITYDATTRLEGAELKLHGQTALSTGNPTQARLDFTHFDIGPLLRMAHVQVLTGESALAGTITVDGPLAHPDQMHGDARIDQVALTVAGVHLESPGGVHATLANARITLDPLHVTGDQTDLHAQVSLSLKDQRQLDLAANGSINLKLAETLDPDLTAGGTTTFQIEAHGPLKNPGLQGRVDFENGSLSLEDIPNGLSQLHGTLEFNQNRLEVKSLTAMSGGGLLSVTGSLAYQHGIYADLSVIGKGIRIRYPPGVSSLADTTLHLQGSQSNLLLSGDVLITRFSVSPDLDVAALTAQANSVQTIAPPEAPSNHIRLDVHVVSSPQLNFQNAYAKLAGDVDLRLRGTVASPSLLGRFSITEGTATIAGTRYELQRGDIFFTNPVRIEPSIDLNATARVEDYDITLGLHGTPEKMAVTYRSDPPLPEADVVALLALGRTGNQQRLYTQQQEQSLANPTTDALLGGALNATVSSRVQKLFGAGSVKLDPNYLGALGNSTSRIIVEEQLGRNLTLTYATNVNTTSQQLIQAEVAINRQVSLLIARDESGVFSMVVKATRRFR